MKIFMLLTLLLFVSCNPCPTFAYSDTQIAQAIYHAEGGHKAKYAYGIRSVKYRNIAHAREICLRSIRNGRKRWIEAGKPCDLITFIGKRYCPPKAHPLNSNWVKNVKYFLKAL